MLNSKKCYKFDLFLDKARKIVAEHRAQYHGVYYMKGGFLGEVLSNPVTQFASDAVAVLTGNPELIPLINAGERAAGGALRGESIGKALGQGALAGAEAFAGQEVLGAAANAFPETAGSLGIGAGGNSLTDLLGTTTGAGSLTGSGTIGGDISNLFGGSGAGGVPTSTGGIPTDASSNPTAQPSGVPVSAQTAGNLGGGASGGAAAPAGYSADTGLPTNFDTSSLDNTINSLQNTGSPLTNSGNVGTGTVGTPSIGNAGTFNISNPSGTPSISDLGSNIQSGGSTGSTLGDIGNTISGGSNTPSPATVAANENTFSSLPSSVPNLSGGQDSISPSLASAGNAAGSAAVKTPNSIGEFISHPSLGNLGTALESNVSPLIAAGGIGLDALKGNKQSGAEKNIEAQAGQLGAQGTQLQNYLQTGTLPAGEQAGVNQALQSAIASIKSRYASMGMSGSSAEQQDIANATQQAQAATAQMQEQLLSTGINETGMSSQLYSELLKSLMANDSSLSGAIANFASAAAGGGNFGKGGQIVLQQAG